MLAEFSRFVKEVFPSVTAKTATQLAEKAAAGGFTGEQFFATELGDKLCQGDIVDGLTWVVESDKGSYNRDTLPGMLVSHSCDVDNHEWITFAPCKAFNAQSPQAADIKRNAVIDVYYMPAHQGKPARIADLGQLQAMRTERVLRGLTEGIYARTDTLTLAGYYHFILKLTMHFLRPPPPEEKRYACAVPLRERIEYAWRAGIGLARYVARGSSVG